MEKRIALGEEEFRTLVSGGVVEVGADTDITGTSVKIILSDIGWHKMLEILMHASAGWSEVSNIAPQDRDKK